MLHAVCTIRNLYRGKFGLTGRKWSLAMSKLKYYGFVLLESTEKGEYLIKNATIEDIKAGRRDYVTVHFPFRLC